MTSRFFPWSCTRSFVGTQLWSLGELFYTWKLLDMYSSVEYREDEAIDSFGYGTDKKVEELVEQ